MNIPSKAKLDSLPRLYATEGVTIAEKLIYLHFYLDECHWYAAEFNGEDIFFGYAVLHGDFECAEWGYFIAMTEFEAPL